MYVHAQVRSFTGTLMDRYVHADVHSSRCTFIHMYIHARVLSCTGSFMHWHGYLHVRSCRGTFMQRFVHIIIYTKNARNSVQTILSMRGINALFVLSMRGMDPCHLFSFWAYLVCFGLCSAHTEHFLNAYICSPNYKMMIFFPKPHFRTKTSFLEKKFQNRRL